MNKPEKIPDYHAPTNKIRMYMRLGNWAQYAEVDITNPDAVGRTAQERLQSLYAATKAGD